MAWFAEKFSIVHRNQAFNQPPYTLGDFFGRKIHRGPNSDTARHILYSKLQGPTSPRWIFSLSKSRDTDHSCGAPCCWTQPYKTTL